MIAFLHSEVWTDIVGYENLYQVSNTGKIKRLAGKHPSIRKERIFSPSVKKNGYLYVSLSNNGDIKYFLVHRLVALSFIPNPDNKPEVNHIDGNKLNNNDWNLEWNTGSENMIHAVRNGLTQKSLGENANNSKLTEIQVLEIRKSKLSQSKLALKYNISKSSIQFIKAKKTWRHVL